MKLSTWAKKNDIAYGTALRWFHEGTLPAEASQLSTGTILVNTENVNNKLEKDCSDDNLVRIIKGLESFCKEDGLKIKIVIEK